jgi:hypothetical protein
LTALSTLRAYQAPTKKTKDSRRLPRVQLRTLEGSFPGLLCLNPPALLLRTTPTVQT